MNLKRLYYKIAIWSKMSVKRNQLDFVLKTENILGLLPEFIFR